MALRMVKKKYVGNVEKGNTETSTNSSTGSNNICVEKQHEDSSNPPNKIVGYFFKRSDVNQQNQENGPYDSTAESALSPMEVNYTPMMISNELCKYKFDTDIGIKIYVLLASDDKEMDLLLGVPPKFRMDWIMKRVHKDGVDVKECLLKIKKRSEECNVDEEPLKKKLKSGLDVEKET